MLLLIIKSVYIYIYTLFIFDIVYNRYVKVRKNEYI